MTTRQISKVGDGPHAFVRLQLEQLIKGEHDRSGPPDVSALLEGARGELAELPSAIRRKHIVRTHLPATAYLLAVVADHPKAFVAFKKALGARRGAPRNLYRQQMIGLSVALRVWRGLKRSKSIADVAPKWKLATESIDDICDRQLPVLNRGHEFFKRLAAHEDPDVLRKIWGEFEAALDTACDLTKSQFSPAAVWKIYARE